KLGTQCAVLTRHVAPATSVGAARGNQCPMLRSDGGRDLTSRLLGIVSTEDRVDHRDPCRAVHHNLHRTVGGDATNGNRRVIDERLEALKAVDTDSASGITLRV